MPSSTRRLPILDGVRGIAILMVMAFHLPKVPANGLERVLARLSIAGQTGVDLFFVLSGFLITGILLEAKGTSHVLRNFYVRRVLRIFPLYYGVLAVLYVLLPGLKLTATTPFSEQLWLWSYTQNIGLTFFHTSGPNHLWSLAVEEHFYLLWPLIVVSADVRRLTRWLFGLVAVSVAVRWELISFGYGSFYFTLSRLDGLAFGALLAVAATETGGLARLKPHAWKALAFGTVLLVALNTSLSGLGLSAVQVVKSTVISAWFSALLVAALVSPPRSALTSVLSIRPLRSIGKYSYAMYMFHPFVFGILAPLLAGYMMVLQFTIATTVTYACAIASWHVWEYPFLQLKERFTYSQ